MALYLIGLGLGGEDDITLRGLKLVQGADLVFLESYTSVLLGTEASRLEEAYGLSTNSIRIADRELVESKAETELLEPAAFQGKKVALLVVGDPVCATTHADLILRAKRKPYNLSVVEVVHNASIMGAAGACGLQLYNFGITVSIPFFDDKWRPTSFYPKIHYNRKGGLHTLCLLDIKVKEPDYEAMMRGSRGTKYLPPRFMSVRTAAEQLIEAEDRHGEGAYDASSTLCVGLARMGQPAQCIRAGTLRELHERGDELFGDPLHSLIICGDDLHDMELEALKEYIVEGSAFRVNSNAKDGKTDPSSNDKLEAEAS